MSKIITVPLCWMVYKVNDDAVAIIGSSVQTPPLIVLETLVMEGKAKRKLVIHSLHTSEIDEGETHFHEESDEDGPSGDIWKAPGDDDE